MQTEINDLQKQESQLRSQLLNISKKKGAVQERVYLQKEIDVYVNRIQFLKALSQFQVGTQVTAPHRKSKLGMVTGFQKISDRVCGVWVMWEGSNVSLPECPILLQRKDDGAA